MYIWITKSVKGIRFVYATQEDDELHCNYRANRCVSIQTEHQDIIGEVHEQIT